MRTIKRKYETTVILEKATGVLGKRNIGTTAIAQIEISGEESTIKNLNGKISIVGKIKRYLDKNYKPVDFDAIDANFEENEITISNGIVKITKDTEKATLIALIKILPDGKTINPISITIETKGFLTRKLADNLELTGIGEQDDEDVVVETQTAIKA